MARETDPALIAVDWGTSSLRLYLVAADGSILETREGAEGVMNVPAGDFAGTLTRWLAGWPADALPILMCGMVGSRQGWREVPYLDCPVAPADLGRALAAVESGTGRGIWIMPGLRCRDDAGVPDVMRGEEAQLLGALAGPDAGTEMDCCLPGTHSKHVRISAGRILSFSSHMTGEVFALLTRQGIIGRLMPDGLVSPDAEAFAAGIRRSAAPGGLLHQIFGARTLPLMEELSPPAIGDYLSGILIGHELRATRWHGEVRVMAGSELVARYVRAFEALRIPARAMPADLSARGLWLIARQAGILA
ncbi:MAG: 2-dehydro-3-deoxygalactonokinase [Alphaproteobacteria bacterium]|nr:2-dehydro-3-deoxygalactonokinase [Alphaproteobacteria bacterium]